MRKIIGAVGSCVSKIKLAVFYYNSLVKILLMLVRQKKYERSNVTTSISSLLCAIIKNNKEGNWRSR